MRGYYIGWKYFYERFRGIEEALWATARFLISSVAWKSLSFFLFRSKHNRYDSKISENIRLYVEILTRITLNSLHLRDSLNSRWTSLNKFIFSEIEVIYTFNEIIPITNYFPSSTLTKRSIENAATLFTRGQPISSVPGEQTKEHPLTSAATHRRQRAIRGQVSFNPINFHDTLHGTHSSTTRIFPRSLGIGPSTRGTGGGLVPLLLPFPITIEDSSSPKNQWNPSVVR